MEHTPEELAHLIGDCTWGEAKLMLAAPALLEALEWAVHELENAANSREDELSAWMNRLDFDELEQARAAIESAKGDA